MYKITKLYWQCRRGTLELDLLLKRYLDTQYVQAELDEKKCFIELLALEDNVLSSLLLSDLAVDSFAMEALLVKIRN